MNANRVVLWLSCLVVWLSCLIVIFVALNWLYRKEAAAEPPQVFLTVILDPDHAGKLLCNGPTGKFKPCTVEVRGDGWAVHFGEQP